MKLLSIASLALIASTAVHADEVLTFKQGTAGYAGTQDTQVRSASPNTNYGALTYISVDGDDGSPGLQPNHGIVRFDGLFGTGADQIQTGQAVVSAQLRVYVQNPGSGMTLHDMLIDWSQSTATWNSLQAGISADGVEASSQALASIGSNNGSENIGNGWLSFDVTSSLQQWQAGTLPGYGWAMLPFTNGTNGIDFVTSEGALSLRPELVVTVSAVPEAQSWAMMALGMALGWAALRRRQR